MANVFYIDGSGFNGKIARTCVYDSNRSSFSILEYTEHLTNNEAEYIAVISALEYSSSRDQIFSDSLLVVNQINHIWKIHNSHLKPYCTNARNLIAQKTITLSWVPREENIAGLKLEERI